MMAKLTRPQARDIVCDALSGLTNPIPLTGANEKLRIGPALIVGFEFPENATPPPPGPTRNPPAAG